jgi:hypothetical protein
MILIEMLPLQILIEMLRDRDADHKWNTVTTKDRSSLSIFTILGFCKETWEECYAKPEVIRGGFEEIGLHPWCDARVFRDKPHLFKQLEKVVELDTMETDLALEELVDRQPKVEKQRCKKKGCGEMLAPFQRFCYNCGQESPAYNEDDFKAKRTGSRTKWQKTNPQLPGTDAIVTPERRHVSQSFLGDLMAKYRGRNKTPKITDQKKVMKTKASPKGQRVV